MSKHMQVTIEAFTPSQGSCGYAPAVTKFDLLPTLAICITVIADSINNLISSYTA